MDNPQPQVQDQVQEKPKRDKKMVVLLAVMVVVIMGLVGVVLYLVQQNNQLRKQLAVSPTPRPEDDQPLAETPDPTADWEIYTNNTNGFSFQYPSDWELSDQLIEYSNLQVLKSGPTNGKFDWTDGSVLIITFNDYDQEVAKYFAGVELAEFSYQDWQGVQNKVNEGMNFNESIIVKKNYQEGKEIVVAWSQMDERNGLSAEKYFLPMLSSFKFFEPSESSGTPDIFTRQLMMARDTEREAHLHAITSAVYQYAAEHDGNLPSYYGVDFPTTQTCIGAGLGCFNLGGAGAPDSVVPIYIVEIPKDPLNGTEEETGYKIYLTETGRVHATAKGELKEISITR